MKAFLHVVVFSLFTIVLFSGYANFGIPQIEPAPPPKEEKIDLDSINMDQFIALGEITFNGKGKCTLCHNAVGGRAPLLDKVATLAEERISHVLYQGNAKTAEEYLYESMLKPSAFVVPGFGKTAQNEESPMTDVSGGSIALSEPEIKAVMAYLQDIAGLDVTVEIAKQSTTKSHFKEESKINTAPSVESKRPSYQTHEEIITTLNCLLCHQIKGSGGFVGPDLSTIGASKNKEYLRRALLDPIADIADGYSPSMPSGYGDQLYASELEILVTYLSSLK